MAEDLRKLAKEMYFASEGKRELKSIADELKVSPSTMRSWKNRGNWDALLKQRRILGDKKKRCTLQREGEGDGATQHDATVPEVVLTKKGKPAKSPGLVGNTHAVGHGGKPGNKNALKHGLYETIKYSDFTEDEKLLLDCVGDDTVTYYQRMIAEYEVREKRMYRRLEELYSNYREQYEEGLMADGWVDLTMFKPGQSVTKSKRAIYQAILDTEGALTYLQDKKRQAIDGLQRAELALSMRDLGERKFELAAKKFEKESSAISESVTIVFEGEAELED